MDESQKKVVIELRDVKRDFLVGEETVHALRGVSFKIYEGEFVTIMGKSGSGKSTLLNQLGCLDTPTSGDYFLDGVAVRTMSKSQRAVLRNRKIGFIFQNYNLSGQDHERGKRRTAADVQPQHHAAGALRPFRGCPEGCGTGGAPLP